MTDYAAILKKEVVPALGCTEPIAVAYAAACAARALSEPVEEIEVLASRNILKNAMSVGIPGSDMAGIPIAAALGALGGDADAGLEVLHTVLKEHVEAGKRMIDAGKVRVSQKSGCESVYVEVGVKGNGHSASAVIQRTHTNVTDVVPVSYTHLDVYKRQHVQPPRSSCTTSSRICRACSRALPSD